MRLSHAYALLNRHLLARSRIPHNLSLMSRLRNGSCVESSSEHDESQWHLASAVQLDFFSRAAIAVTISEISKELRCREPRDERDGGEGQARVANCHRRPTKHEIRSLFALSRATSIHGSCYTPTPPVQTPSYTRLILLNTSSDSTASRITSDSDEQHHNAHHARVRRLCRHIPRIRHAGDGA